MSITIKKCPSFAIIVEHMYTPNRAFTIVSYEWIRCILTLVNLKILETLPQLHGVESLCVKC